jgi:hypothetical protein
VCFSLNGQSGNPSFASETKLTCSHFHLKEIRNKKAARKGGFLERCKLGEWMVIFIYGKNMFKRLNVNWKLWLLSVFLLLLADGGIFLWLNSSDGFALMGAIPMWFINRVLLVVSIVLGLRKKFKDAFFASMVGVVITAIAGVLTFLADWPLTARLFMF